MAEARILLVEDDQVLLENLAEILRAEGFDVLTAEDGRRAQVMAGEVMPDLMVSDVMMPDMDGFTLASELSREAHTALIPIIFLTAKTSREEFREGMDLGAEDYLPKPCPADKLLSVIRMRLAKRRRLQKALVDQWRGMGLRHLTLPPEISTPLRQILGFTAVLTSEDADLPQEEIRQVAHEVQAAGFRLARKVTQVRVREAAEQAARVHFVESETHCDVAAVLKRAIKQRALFGPRASDIRISIEPATVLIREGIVSAVLAEILDNAIRYSEPRTPVNIRGEITPDGYLVSVQDQGPGIIAERLAELSRHPQPINVHWSGLTTAKNLLGSCSIELKIDSLIPAGTTVQFTVPIARSY